MKRCVEKFFLAWLIFWAARAAMALATDASTPERVALMLLFIFHVFFYVLSHLMIPDKPTAQEKETRRRLLY